MIANSSRGRNSNYNVFIHSRRLEGKKFSKWATFVPPYNGFRNLRETFFPELNLVLRLGFSLGRRDWVMAYSGCRNGRHEMPCRCVVEIGWLPDPCYQTAGYYCWLLEQSMTNGSIGWLLGQSVTTGYFHWLLEKSMTNGSICWLSEPSLTTGTIADYWNSHWLSEQSLIIRTVTDYQNSHWLLEESPTTGRVTDYWISH